MESAPVNIGKAKHGITAEITGANSVAGGPPKRFKTLNGGVMSNSIMAPYSAFCANVRG